MTFLEQVRQKRQKLADVLYDDDYSGIREIVEELYPDRAHFIYELLQNAEDAGATEARFVLSSDLLTFTHNGRPFSEPDVWAITNIGKGTKKEQEDQIGRFGVGFKAVFAYCETPRIYSPTFSFEISQLVLPTEIPARPDLGNDTLFEFPLNSNKKTPLVAHKEIQAGLEELAETTLLFLSHLHAVSWKIGVNGPGRVRRLDHTPQHIEIVKITSTTTSSHFLRFSQPVPALPKQRLSVAYPLDFLPNITALDPAKPIASQLKITAAAPGRVAVFFPAEKETSGLRFHLHAPFVPELSRASIKETAANDPLFADLAKLAATSLQDIRNLGLLTVEFLGILPNPQDNLSPRYKPVRDAIIQAMDHQPLTPTHHKSHSPAKILKQSKAVLKDLLSLEDIEYLIEYEDQPPQWAIAVPQKNSNADRFLSGLAIADWGTPELLAVLKQKATSDASQKPDAEFLDWLKAKPLEWHQEFYSLLNKELGGDDQIKQLEDLQIVRLSTGEYSIGRHCFFPTAKVENDDKFPRVAKGVYTSGKSTTQQEEAKDLLESIGVREVGENEQVEAILKERYGKTNFTPKIEDLPRWVALVEKDPESAKLFKGYFILQRDDGKWGTPGAVFLDSPFLQTGLSIYYNALRSATGKDDHPRPLAAAYENCEVTAKRLVAFAKAVGVTTNLDSINDLLPILPHIKSTVEAGTPDIAAIQFVWNRICHYGAYDWHCLEEGRQYHKGWGHYGTTYSPSSLCYRLQYLSWIPQKTSADLSFVTPAQASRELLPDGFPFDSGWRWLHVLGFGQDAMKQVQKQAEKESEAKALGFADSKTLDRARRFAQLPPEEQERILAEREKSKELPDQKSANQERRDERVEQKAKDAPGREKEKRMRSVSVGLGDVKDECEQYLRHQYTNPDGAMICQICQAPLPFKLESGAYYFEKVEFLPELKKRHHQNYLALCPNHSAMFRFANASQDNLKALFTAINGQRMDVVLAQTNFSIYFTQMHIADLKKVIEVDSTPQASPPSPSVATPARPLPNGLVQCPYCPSPVRPDRLQDHIANVHTNPRPKRRTSSPPPTRPRSGSSGTFIRCRGCGRPAIPGDDYCYSCRSE